MSNSSSESMVRSEPMLGDCTRGEVMGDGAKTCSGVLRASTECMSENGDWIRDAGNDWMSSNGRPRSETTEPPSGVLYADVRACDALMSGVGRREEKTDWSESTVEGVAARDESGEKFDIGVGRPRDMPRGGGEAASAARG